MHIDSSPSRQEPKNFLALVQFDPISQTELPGQEDSIQKEFQDPLIDLNASSDDAFIKQKNGADGPNLFSERNKVPEEVINDPYFTWRKK